MASSIGRNRWTSAAVAVVVVLVSAGCATGARPTVASRVETTTTTAPASPLEEDLADGPRIGRVGSPLEVFDSVDLDGQPTSVRPGLPGAPTGSDQGTVLIVDAADGAAEIVLPDLTRVWVPEDAVASFPADVTLTVDVGRSVLVVDGPGGTIDIPASVGSSVATWASREFLFTAELIRTPEAVRELWGESMLVVAGSSLTTENLVSGDGLVAITGQILARSAEAGGPLPGEVAIASDVFAELRSTVPLGSPLTVSLPT